GPVTDQYREKQDHLSADLREQENDRGNSIADRDPLQHASIAERFKAKLQQIVVNQTEEEKQRDSSREPYESTGFRLIAGLVFAERKRQHDADGEQEQREDQIVETEALPVDMMKLLGEALTE